MMKFNLTKTSSGFKILSVNVFGEVLINPLGDQQNGVASVTNQTLVLQYEKTFKKMIYLNPATLVGKE